MAYVDGELPAAEATAVTDHLRTCSRCSEEEAELRALAGAVDRQLAAYAEVLTADGVDVSAAWTRLQARLRATPRPHWFHQPWISIVAMAAVVCLVFGIGTGLRQFGSVPQLPPLASSLPVYEQKTAAPHEEVQPEETDARERLAPLAENESSGRREAAFNLMAEPSASTADSDLMLAAVPEIRAADDAATSDPAPDPALASPSGRSARAGHSQGGGSVHALSTPVLTPDLVSGAKFGKDAEGIRPLPPEEIDRIIVWRTTAPFEPSAEEQPPPDGLRIDLKDGRQIAVGSPRAETVLVSGLYGPGCIRLTSPELAAFLAALDGEVPAGESSATLGRQEGTASPEVAEASDAPMTPE